MCVNVFVRREREEGGLPGPLPPPQQGTLLLSLRSFLEDSQKLRRIIFLPNSEEHGWNILLRFGLETAHTVPSTLPSTSHFKLFFFCYLLNNNLLHSRLLKLPLFSFLHRVLPVVLFLVFLKMTHFLCLGLPCVFTHVSLFLAVYLFFHPAMFVPLGAFLGVCSIGHKFVFSNLVLPLFSHLHFLRKQ